ncbi:hypothetical protein GQ457_06G015630 [Hibiscus cannabinus]
MVMGEFGQEEEEERKLQKFFAKSISKLSLARNPIVGYATTIPLGFVFSAPKNAVANRLPWVFPLVKRRLAQEFTSSFLECYNNSSFTILPFSLLPTLLPSKSILVTNTTPSNFTLNDSHISHPDLYLPTAITVHGITSLFNYTVYDGDPCLENGIAQPLPQAPPPPPPKMFEPLGA